MSDAPVELDELVDLKMLPAWVNEPPPGERYAQHQGQDRREDHGRDRRPRDKQRSDRGGPRREFDRATSKEKRTERPQRDHRGPPRVHDRHRKDRHRPLVEKPLPPIAVKFLPRTAAFENVVAQIKSGSVAYSLFALARLFLEKATRHDVKLTAPPESPMFQLGENGAISVDRQFLERSAFRFAEKDFYKIDITETEPIKGNFNNVARCRLSGTLLGPTSHHDYQRRLRNLFEQRFSRRMSFADYQRQIQIVTNPEEIEKWKEDARKVTTYSTLRPAAAGPQTFSSLTEAERHFEKNYLPTLVRAVSETVIDGPASRHLHDRVLNRVIENEWNRETNSPWPMMQELGARFRETGLHIFRHRRGMLFVSSIYPRAFTSQQTAVSSQVRTIIDAIAASPRIGRKELADKLIVDLSAEDADRAKMALASDLLWLISAGHVIEFNDGSLDLPRAKAKPKDKEKPVEAGVPDTPQPSEGGSPAIEKENGDAAASAAEKEVRVEAGAPATPEQSEGGPPAEESIEEPTEIGGS